MKHKLPFAGTLFAALVALSNAGCGSAPPPAQPPTPVTSAEVTLYQATPSFKYSASLVPNGSTVLAFKSGGYVTEILQLRGPDGRMHIAQEGDFVRKGQVLARVRQNDYQASLVRAQGQLDAAKAGVTKANEDFARAKALFASNSLTKVDYDSAVAEKQNADATLVQAQGGIDSAQISLHDTALIAPTDGYITSRNIEIGTLAAVGQQAFGWADLHVVKAVFGVPDTMINAVKTGRHQAITIEAVPGNFDGVVTAVSPQADPKTRLFSVEVSIANPKNILKGGMIASLVLTGAKDSVGVPVVPLAAIVSPANGSNGFGVYVLKTTANATVAEWRPITVGETYGNRVGVLAGVQPHETVAVAGANRLRDGDKAQITQSVQ